MPASSVQQVRRRRRIALVAVGLVLLGLITYGIMRPSPEEQDYMELRDSMLSQKPGERDEESRQQMRKMMDKLSPETRKKLIREVSREHLRRARERTANMTETEKKAEIQKMTNRVRERFSRMTEEQRQKARDRLNSEEGKERLRGALDFYQTEFTAKERELFDPLVKEIMTSLDQL